MGYSPRGLRESDMTEHTHTHTHTHTESPVYGWCPEAGGCFWSPAARTSRGEGSGGSHIEAMRGSLHSERET